MNTIYAETENPVGYGCAVDYEVVAAFERRRAQLINENLFRYKNVPGFAANYLNTMLGGISNDAELCAPPETAYDRVVDDLVTLVSEKFLSQLGVDYYDYYVIQLADGSLTARSKHGYDILASLKRTIAEADGQLQEIDFEHPRNVQDHQNLQNLLGAVAQGQTRPTLVDLSPSPELTKIAESRGYWGASQIRTHQFSPYLFECDEVQGVMHASDEKVLGRVDVGVRWMHCQNEDWRHLKVPPGLQYLPENPTDIDIMRVSQVLTDSPANDSEIDRFWYQHKEVGLAHIEEIKFYINTELRSKIKGKVQELFSSQLLRMAWEGEDVSEALYKLMDMAIFEHQLLRIRIGEITGKRTSRFAGGLEEFRQLSVQEQSEIIRLDGGLQGCGTQELGLFGDVGPVLKGLMMGYSFENFGECIACKKVSWCGPCQICEDCDGASDNAGGLAA